MLATRQRAGKASCIFSVVCFFGPQLLSQTSLKPLCPMKPATAERVRFAKCVEPRWADGEGLKNEIEQSRWRGRVALRSASSCQALRWPTATWVDRRNVEPSHQRTWRVTYSSSGAGEFLPRWRLTVVFCGVFFLVCLVHSWWNAGRVSNHTLV